VAGWVRRSGAAVGRFFAKWMFQLHVLLVLAAGALLILPHFTGLFSDLNPAPSNTDRHTCLSLLGSDDLKHLALRSPSAARAQIDRWRDCASSSLLQDARHSLFWDRVLIALIAVAFALAVGRLWSRRRARGRLMAFLGGTLAIVYVIADLKEDSYLGSLLSGSGPVRSMQWAAAIKFGAFFGALPIFLVSA
jgi:hypothetical protein